MNKLEALYQINSSHRNTLSQAHYDLFDMQVDYKPRLARLSTGFRMHFTQSPSPRASCRCSSSKKPVRGLKPATTYCDNVSV